MHFDEVQCTGVEGSLGQCMFISGDNDCDHSEDAGVKCVGEYQNVCTTMLVIVD